MSTTAPRLVILGLDSLAAVQLQNRLQRSLKMIIEPGVVWVRPTPAGLADWILERMALTPPPEEMH